MKILEGYFILPSSLFFLFYFLPPLHFFIWPSFWHLGYWRFFFHLPNVTINFNILKTTSFLCTSFLRSSFLWSSFTFLLPFFLVTFFFRTFAFACNISFLSTFFSVVTAPFLSFLYLLLSTSCSCLDASSWSSVFWLLLLVMRIPITDILWNVFLLLRSKHLKHKILKELTC